MLNYIIDSRDKDFSAMSTMLNGMLAACRAEKRKCSQATRFVFEPPKQYTEYIFQFADRVVSSAADVGDAPSYVSGDLGAVVTDVNLVPGGTGTGTGAGAGTKNPVTTFERNTVQNTQDYINLATNLTSDFVVFPDLWLAGFNFLLDNYKRPDVYLLASAELQRLRAEAIKNKMQNGTSAKYLAEIKIQEIVQNIIPNLSFKPYEYVQHVILARSLYPTMQENDLKELLKSRPLVAPPVITNLVTFIDYIETADTGPSTGAGAPVVQNNTITTKVYFSTSADGMILLSVQNAPSGQTGPAVDGNNTILGNNFSNYQLAEKFITDNYEWYKLGLYESFYTPPKGDGAITTQPVVTPVVTTNANNWGAIALVYNIQGDGGNSPVSILVFNSPNVGDGPSITGNTQTLNYPSLSEARNDLVTKYAWFRAGVSETINYSSGYTGDANNWRQITIVYDVNEKTNLVSVTVLNAPNSSTSPQIQGNTLVLSYSSLNDARSDLQTNYAWFRGGKQEVINFVS